MGVAPAWSTSPTVTALTTGSISNSGNTTNTGTGSRFLADFTNATITNRLAFQTSTTNSTTGIYALPNGTSTAASWQATNAADPTNASKVLIATNGSTDVQLVSGINGTGTYLPLSFFTNGSGQFAINTSGAFGIGSVAGATVSYGTSGQLFVSGGSAAQPSWTSPTSIAVTSINFGTTGLTPSTATQGAVTVAGTLVAANGGTGLTSFTSGGAVYATSTSALTTGTLPIASGGTNSTATPTAGGIGYGTGTAHAYTAVGTSGQPLISAGAGAPAFGTLALGTANTNVSGTLTVTNGGTGAGTFTANGVIYGNTTSALGVTAAGTTGQVLIATTSAAPSWGQVSLTAGVTGTLPVANGGTGITTTPSNGFIPIGNGTNYTAAALTAGAGITITNASGSVTVAGTGSTINSQTTGYTLVAADAGKTISITTGGVTVPNSILSAGNIVTIYNNSGSSQTITQGTGVTLQWAGQSSSSTGNRTLGLYGICTIIFISSSNAVISGAGLT